MSWYNKIPVVSTALGMQEEDQGPIKAQKALSTQLEAAAMGGAPSAAEIQGRQAADRSVATQYALAASQPGMAPAASMQVAARGAADVQQQMSAQAAAQRAEEQARARALYAQQLMALRGGNLQMQQMNAAALGGTLSAAGQAMGVAGGK